MTSFLTSTLKSIRITRSNFWIVDICRGESVAYPKSDAVYFHLILNGACKLSGLPNTDYLQMEKGDYLFIFDPCTHIVYQHADNPSARTVILWQNSDHEVTPIINIGVGKPELSMISGVLELESGISPFLKVLPSWLVLNSHTRRRRFDTAHSASLRDALGKSGSSAFLSRLVELYLIESIRVSTSDVVWTDESPMSNRSLSNILSTVQIMATELEQKWSVSTLAQRAHMSRSAYAMAFHQAIGKPPLQFLTELRMQRAAELLTREASAIKEISFVVGYNSELAFSRAFRKFYGVTPSRFRRNTFANAADDHSQLDHWRDFIR